MNILIVDFYYNKFSFADFPKESTVKVHNYTFNQY